MCGKPTPLCSLPSEPPTERMVEPIREGVPEAAVLQGSYIDIRAEITSKVSARGYPLFFGILPNFKNVKRNRVVNSVTKCAFVHRQVDDQLIKKPKKNGDKSAVEKLKGRRQLGCVLQDTEPPKSFFMHLREERKSLETNSKCTIRKSCALTKERSSARNYLSSRSL